MSPYKKLLLIILTIAFWQFGFAFFASPHACEWGLPAYFWFGMIVFIVLFLLPFFMLKQHGYGFRLGVATLCGLLELALWVAGAVLADMQLICRLF